MEKRVHNGTFHEQKLVQNSVVVHCVLTWITTVHHEKMVDGHFGTSFFICHL